MSKDRKSISSTSFRTRPHCYCLLLKMLVSWNQNWHFVAFSPCMLALRSSKQLFRSCFFYVLEDSYAGLYLGLIVQKYTVKTVIVKYYYNLIFILKFIKINNLIQKLLVNFANNFKKCIELNNYIFLYSNYLYFICNFKKNHFVSFHVSYISWSFRNHSNIPI